MKVLVVSIVSLATLSSCGYRMSGIGALLPPEARTIAVLAFLNATYEPGVDIEVTRAVTNEFLADGRLTVTDPGDADLVLTGTVTSYEAAPVAFTAGTYARQYRVRMKVDASLEERKTGKVLWQEKRIDSSLVSTYEAAFDEVPVIDPATGLQQVDPKTGLPVTKQQHNIRDTKTSKSEAIRKAGKDIAWTIRSRVLEGF